MIALSAVQLSIQTFNDNAVMFIDTSNKLIRGFHKHTKLATLALLPTLYSQKFEVFFFIWNTCC